MAPKGEGKRRTMEARGSCTGPTAACRSHRGLVGGRSSSRRRTSSRALATFPRRLYPRSCRSAEGGRPQLE